MAQGIDPRDTTDPAEILRATLDPERCGALRLWLHRLPQVAPVFRGPFFLRGLASLPLRFGAAPRKGISS